MARNRSHAASGRPSKGQRHAFMSRMPMNVATRVMEEADELDVTYSDFIAHLVAARYGIDMPLTPARDADQKELLLPETA